MSLSLASILAESALRHPGHVAVVTGSERLHYAELWDQACQYGGLLREKGIRPGDRVALMLPNIADFPRAYYGALAIGAVVVPIHALLTPAEIAFVLGDSGAKVLLCGGPLVPAATQGAALAGVPCLSDFSGAGSVEPVRRAVPRD